MENKIKEQIFDEICEALGGIMDKDSVLRREVQPTESVIDLAARAALDVIVAFELGYKTGG